MKISKKNSQKEIKSDTCGLLVEIINSGDFNTSVTVAKDLKPTIAHYHKESTEIYWVRTGNVEIVVKNKQIKLLDGDLLVVKPLEVHQVVKASKRNEVVVLNDPRWQKSDEYIVQ